MADMVVNSRLSLRHSKETLFGTSISFSARHVQQLDGYYLRTYSSRRSIRRSSHMFNMGRRSIVYLVTRLDNYNFSLHLPILWLLLLLASFDKVQSAEDLFHPLK